MVTRTIDLSTLRAAQGFTIQGDVAGDRAGGALSTAGSTNGAVSSAGDINGDGIDDIIVGASYGDNGGAYAGEAYVVFGKAGGARADIDLTSLSATDGFIIQGDTGSNFAGWNVASAGDVNGDGLDDLIVTAPYGANGGGNAGEAYVIFGKTGASRANIDLTSFAASDGFIVQGVTEARIGLSVSSAGDINGDGIDDLFIGAPRGDIGGYDTGQAYVIFGKAGATRPNVNLSTLAATDGFVVSGNSTFFYAGVSVSSAGDVNGDGVDDLILGAPFRNNGGTNAGEAYVIFGKAGATRASIDLASFAATDGFVVKGAATLDGAGWSVSSAGDINGDGFDDLIVGTRGADSDSTNPGKAYVIFGTAGAARTDIDLATLSAADGFLIEGDAARDGAGRSVSSAGDVNGDGFDDLLVGAAGRDDGGSDAGGAYLIFGKAGATRDNIDLTSLAAADGFFIQGDAAGDVAGGSVSSAGDINNDGFDDLIIGARGNDDGGDNAGAAYVIYGRADLDAAPLAVDDSLKATKNVAAVYAPFQLLGNDQSPYTLSISAVSNAIGGTVVLNADKTVTFTPTVGFTGNASFDYLTSDGAASDSGHVVIAVTEAVPAGRIDLGELALEAGFAIQGDVAQDGAGVSVSSAGDVNGDGIDDVIVGALDGDNGGANAGEAYVIFGKATATRGNIDLSSLSASDGFIIQGDVAGDRAGRSVSSAGDVNGDGIDDLIIGAPFGDNGGYNAGEAYIVFGKAGATRANIDLTTLTAADGFIIQGDVAEDEAGSSVSSAGDINGDGISDIIVGAPRGDNGGSMAGEAYVIFGKAGATRTNIDLTSLAAADGFVIQGDLGTDFAGTSVSSAGDVNGDGVDDLIVGAFAGDNGGYDAGEAYVIFGKVGATRSNIDLTTLGVNDGFIIQGNNAGDLAGNSVSSAGDINGDGIDDLIVGAYNGDNGGENAGEAYVIFGKAGSTRANIDLSSLAATDGFIIQGDAAGDGAGYSVSSAGDVNGDGFDDLIVGAIFNDDGGEVAGAAYLIYGKAGATRADIDLTSLTTADGFILVGDASPDEAGASVSSAGDINADGFDDLIVGAPLSWDGGVQAGEAYVIYGRDSFDAPPVAVDDSLKATKDVAAVYAPFQLLGNDQSPYTLSIGSVSNAVGGTVVLNADKTVTFTPDTGFTGTASFDYIATDGAYSDTGHVSIAVTAAAVGHRFDLATRTATRGFTVQGDTQGNFAGSSVSSAGDVNGDGVDDLILGAQGNDNGGVEAGAAYVIFGKPGTARADIDLTNLAAADGFMILGDAAGDQAGRSVSAAGDINGDGVNDLIVGAYLGDNGGTNAGEAYVIFGKAGATRTNIDLTSFAAGDGFVIQGDTAYDAGGYSVSSAGDINGDGFDDLIVGAFGGDNGGSLAGEAYVVFGKAGATRTNIDLTSLPAADGFIIQGDSAGDYAGRSVSSAGDINGDGFDDLIVGADGGDNGGADAGEAYVIWGKAGPTRANIDLTSLAAADGFIIQGDTAGDRAGISVSSAGDINGDGLDDLILGARAGDNGGSYAGEAYVIFGKAGATRTNIDLTGLPAHDGFIIQGDAAGDWAGSSVSAAGDVNGDGFDDLIVGAPRNANGGPNSGEAYLIFGKAGATRADIDLSSLTAADGLIVRATSSGRAGESVSSAGDINDDGFDDLIVGAPLNNDGGAQAGKAYVIYGSADIGQVLPPTLQVTYAGAFPTEASNQPDSGETLPHVVFADVVIGSSAQISGAEVGIGTGFQTGATHQDFLRINNLTAGTIAGSGIAYSYNATTGVMTLSGTATAAQYETAIELIRFSISGDNPTAYGTAQSRTVLVTVSNGAASNQTSGQGAIVTGINDAPVNSVGTSLTFNEDSVGDPVTGISVVDVDADPATQQITVTLNVDAGSLTLRTDVAGGVAAAAVTGNGTDTIRITGTQNQINATLQAVDGASHPNGLLYTPPANFAGAATVTVVTNDGGYTGNDPGLTGTGTSEEDSDSKTLNVTAVDDGPAAVSDSKATDEATATSGNVLTNDTDIDGGAKTVTALNGNAASVGQEIILASGAKLTLHADGSYSYDPNGKFNFLSDGSGGSTNTSATDSFSYTVNGGDTATVTVTINGLASAGDVLGGDSGPNDITGTTGGDIFDLSQGGNDKAHGLGGNDGFYFGAAMTGADEVDGGEGGKDQIGLQGDYTGLNALTLGALSTVGIEMIVLLPGSDPRFGDTSGAFYSYDVTSVDANVGAGETFVVNANTLRAGENLTFNGAAELDGSFLTYGGLGNDHLTGGQKGDGFFFGDGGRFGAGDTVDGQGQGVGQLDQLGLQGNYSGVNAVTFGASQITNIEMIVLLSGTDTRFGGTGANYSFDITMNDGNVASGQKMIINANTLVAAESVTFNGSAETNGYFQIFSGNGDDTYIGSQGNDDIWGGGGADTITGGLGADTLHGGAGNDSFRYTSTAHSTELSMDSILDFATGDKVDVSAIDAMTGGTDDAFSFVGSAAFTGTGTAELQAVNTSGNDWTISADVDGNGSADLVIAMTVTDAHSLTAADFVL